MMRGRLRDIHDAFDREHPAPYMEGFGHVADAANESIRDIIRHVRYEAHNAPTKHKGTHGNRTAITRGEKR